jgi:hypothetical protein
MHAQNSHLLTFSAWDVLERMSGLLNFSDDLALAEPCKRIGKLLTAGSGPRFARFLGMPDNKDR